VIKKPPLHSFDDWLEQLLANYTTRYSAGGVSKNDRLVEVKLFVASKSCDIKDIAPRRNHHTLASDFFLSLRIAR